MTRQRNRELLAKQVTDKEYSNLKQAIFSKDYVDFLNEAGWRLEKKPPPNINNYSNLLEDTDWKSSNINFRCSKHYRRDLDALGWNF